MPNFYDGSLPSLLPNRSSSSSKVISSSDDNRRAVVHFRLFLVLRPPNFHSQEHDQNEPSPSSASSLMMLNRHQQQQHRMNPKNMQRLTELTRLSRNARKVDLFGRTVTSSSSQAEFQAMLQEAATSTPGTRGDRNSLLLDKKERQRAKAADADGDDDNVTRDIEAEDEADAIWDQYSTAVIPLVLTVNLGQTTVGDVLEKAWPYVVELWRDVGRFWHKNMVPSPLPSASQWFSLRMIGRKWHDPSRASMRSCLEIPVPTLLAGFDFSGFEGLQTSLTDCCFQERALLRSTPIKKLLPEDPDAHLRLARSSSNALARYMSGASVSSSSGAGARDSHSGVSSAVHGGVTDSRRQQLRAAESGKSGSCAVLPRFRMSLLLTLSTEFILQEHIACCETKTREAIFKMIEGFLASMKSVEVKSFECAVRRTVHRKQIEKLFSDLVELEETKRARLREQEHRTFFHQIRGPYEESQATLLPVLREAHAIRMSWREKLAGDMEKEKKKILKEKRKQLEHAQLVEEKDDDEHDFAEAETFGIAHSCSVD